MRGLANILCPGIISQPDKRGKDSLRARKMRRTGAWVFIGFHRITDLPFHSAIFATGRTHKPVAPVPGYI